MPVKPAEFASGADGLFTVAIWAVGFCPAARLPVVISVPHSAGLVQAAAVVTVAPSAPGRISFTRLGAPGSILYTYDWLISAPSRFRWHSRAASVGLALPIQPPRA